MIQSETEILLAKGSSVLKSTKTIGLKSRIINCKNGKIGDLVKGILLRKTVKKGYYKSIIKKTISHLEGKGVSSSKAKKRKIWLNNFLLIQTKKKLNRIDGSSVSFNVNRGVSVMTESGRLGLKRINACVPFESFKNNQFKLKGFLKISKEII